MASKYLVFSAPPEGIAPEEYDHWYHHHIRENLEAPGFVAGQRFELRSAVSTGGPPAVAHTHLALYEYEGELARWRADLEARIGDGRIVLPEWFPRIHFGSWDCNPIDERVVVPEV
jgi:hypothetical protein